MKNNLDKYIHLINNGEKSIVEALYELSELELNAKEKRAIASVVKVANFPF